MPVNVDGLSPMLSVFDMPTSVRFYCEGLGFELAGTDGKPAPRFQWALLRLNGVELMLNTAYEHEKNERPSYGMKQLFVTDPDGYILYFQAATNELARPESSS